MPSTLRSISSRPAAWTSSRLAQASTSTAANSYYDHARGETKTDGYRATFTLSFRCPVESGADRTREIQDVPTSIEGAQVAQPDFKIKDLTALHKAALRDAKAKVDQRFTNECEILGLASYRVDYDDSESAGARPMAALAHSAESPSGGGRSRPVEIRAGQARVTATLHVTYAEKLPAGVVLRRGNGGRTEVTEGGAVKGSRD